MATGLAIISALSAIGGGVQKHEETRRIKNTAEDQRLEAEAAKKAAQDADKKAADETERKRVDRLKGLQEQGRLNTFRPDLFGVKGKTLLGG